LRPGDRVVSITDTYGGTHRIFTEFLPQMGISVELYDPIDEDSLERAIARGCRLVYLESPTNPTLKIVDLQKLADAAHTVGALVVTDNTVATPINQNPLKLGSDLVVHSASKFLGGHGDALGGAIAGSTELVTRVFRYREINGAALDPFAAFLLARGIRTLELRVARQNENALAVARFLESHRAVDRVFYPGLESHPNHDTAAKQMRGFGGMLSFTIRDTAGRGVTAFLDRLRLARKAASLGHVETMAGTPATTSHVECTAAQRAAMGIPDTLVRYSVGIENVADLIEDLQRALN
jgi:cystathionine gamma-synthase